MAKHTAPAVKPRKPAETGKRKFKPVNKKPSNWTNLQKRGILGIVNGFTVTRLEPEKLKTKRVFPESADTPATEAKRVTFAWTEETEQSSESRLHRANERRTHSARDSSADSLNEFDASREPKRRRTSESSIVEDAEARKATSSMRHSKPLLQHSTPAEALERGGSSSKRVFPRTPKPADRTETSANDTFEDTSYRNDDGEGAVEPKVSLASIFDDETNVENGEEQMSGIEKLGEENSLNSDETTVELDVVDLPEVTPVRARSKKVEEAPRMNRTLNENAENASGATVSVQAEDNKCNLEAAVDSVKLVSEESSRNMGEEPQTDPALLSGEEANSTTSGSPLDAASISRLTRRDSRVDSDNLEEDDVFKQRRSQVAFDEEEPMEISVIQAASRRSNAPTPGPDHEKECKAVPSDITPSAEAIPTAEPVGSSGNADLATSAERDEAPGDERAPDIVENPTTSATSETTPKDACEQQPVPGSDSAAAPDSGTIRPEPSDTDYVCNATFEEDEDLELQALSCRIKNISELDETMRSEDGENPARNKAEPDKDSFSSDEADALIKTTQKSDGETSSTVAIVPQGNSVAVPEASSPDGSLTISATVPSGQTHAMNGEENSVLPGIAPLQQTSSASDTAQPNSDALVPVTPEGLSSRTAPFDPDAVLSKEDSALTHEDAGDSRQAEVVSEVLQDPGANAQSGKETGENIPAERHDTDGDLEHNSGEGSIADRGADVIEVGATENLPTLLENGNPEANDPETQDSKTQDSGAEEPDSEVPQTGEPESEKTSTEVLETEDPTTENPNTEKPGTEELESESLQPEKTTSEEAETKDSITADQLADILKVDDPKIDRRKSSEPGDDVVQADQRGAGDADIEKTPETSDTVSDPDPGMKTREKRTRRATKPFSPSTETKETTTTSKKRTTRTQKAATETLVATTPRTSRRVAAKAAAKSATEDESETTLIAAVEKTPAAAKAQKTAAAKTKTPKKAAATSKTPKTEVGESGSPTETIEVPQAPKTPSRAAGSRRASAKTAKTPATSSKATTATPSSKGAKSKQRLQ